MLMMASVVLAGLLALAPNWAVVDIPYPETSGGSAPTSRAGPDAPVIDAVHGYVRKSSAGLRKGVVTDVRIEGTKATAKVLIGQRAETVYLEYVHPEWRVIRTE
jgi:hypothetical protein